MRSRVERLAPGAIGLGEHLSPLLRPAAAEICPAGRACRRTTPSTTPATASRPFAASSPKQRSTAPCSRPRPSAGHLVGEKQPDLGRRTTRRDSAMRWGRSSSGSIRRIRPSWPPPTPSISTTCCFTSPRSCATTPRSAPASTQRYRLHPGRRIPGHQPRPIRHRPGAVDRPSQPGGDRRSGPVDLWLAGRELEQHPGVREATFPMSASFAWSGTTAARSESFASRLGTDLAQSAAEREGPVHRKRRRAARPVDHLCHAEGRGRRHRRADRRRDRAPAAAGRAISPSSIAPTP